MCGTHSEGRFGADAMNKGAGNIWIVCLPLVHSDSSWLWLGAVAEFPYRGWGRGLKSKNAMAYLISSVCAAIFIVLVVSEITLI